VVGVTPGLRFARRLRGPSRPWKPALRARREADLLQPGAEISVTIEKSVPQPALKALEDWGHKVAPTSDFTAQVGGMQAIVVDLEKGTMTAGADPGCTGYAIGY
jgi:gamma-glutamyltranspeptidase